MDAHDTGDTGSVTLEEAHLGVRTQPGTKRALDLSGGAREPKLGTGMLIANGGSSGFERGALKIGSREAWELTGIGQLSYGGWSSPVFYLDANEVPSNDRETELAGLDLRYDGSDRGFLGVTYIHAPASESAHPRAAPDGIGPPLVASGAREGLNVVNAYARTGSLAGFLANWSLSGDIACQWNPRLDMRAWGGRAQLAYTFKGTPWAPRLMHTFQSFSGDDPGTSAQERFDPLFFDGSPSSWATRSKSTMTFISSNVFARQLELGIKPTSQDTLTLRYAHIRVNESRRPVQFGQATRFEIAGGDNVVAGVTKPHPADDVFLEHNRAVSQNIYPRAGVSASFPGKGLETAAGRGLPVWLGASANAVINY